MAAYVPRPLVCDLSALGKADLETIDLLARLQLAARGGMAGRSGFSVRRPRSTRLIVFLPAWTRCYASSRGGRPKRGKTRVGVEEERQLDDPAV